MPPSPLSWYLSSNFAKPWTYESKVFLYRYRVSHNQVIEDLADMHVPGWLLILLVSYLTDRSMYMRYKGASSSRKLLPGSSPQGAFLGILIFIIVFNGALLRPAIPRLHSLNLKYIDDLSMLAAYNLRSCLVKDPVARPRPLKYSERNKSYPCKITLSKMIC